MPILLKALFHYSYVRSIDWLVCWFRVMMVNEFRHPRWRLLRQWRVPVVCWILKRIFRHRRRGIYGTNLRRWRSRMVRGRSRISSSRSSRARRNPIHCQSRGNRRIRMILMRRRTIWDQEVVPCLLKDPVHRWQILSFLSCFVNLNTFYHSFLLFF